MALIGFLNREYYRK